MAIFTASVLTAAAIGAVAVGTVMQVQASRQQASAQREQTRIAQRQANIENARRRVEMVRQARMQQASLMAQAGAQGLTSSGVQGALASSSAQFGANVGIFGQMEAFNQQFNRQQMRISDAQGMAALGQGLQAIGSLGMQAGQRMPRTA